jgi:hypothetical protein
VPEKVPSRLHSPPTSEKADRPGIELASDEPIIALESVSGQDARIDDPFFRET